MAEFMREHGMEAVNMLYTQWNWDDAMAVEREEARIEGENIGDLKRSRQAILDLLEDMGEIPQDIHIRIQAEEDVETLRRWLKAAAKAQSFVEFRERMNKLSN